ncbi:unnamed protein product [Ixodes pacificus]
MLLLHKNKKILHAYFDSYKRKVNWPKTGVHLQINNCAKKKKSFLKNLTSSFIGPKTTGVITLFPRKIEKKRSRIRNLQNQSKSTYKMSASVGRAEEAFTDESKEPSTRQRAWSVRRDRCSRFG